jgi:acetyl-CoA carboxylase carboxyltransferase component
MRAVIEGLADVDSVLELRRGFAAGMITALIRVEGRPMGLIANDPTHLGGAIDHDSADKAARFLQLCDAFGLPVISLCDTPGFMVGTESETHATVRHFSRLFVTGANLSVPLGLIVIRKCYGLGAQSMSGGSLKAPTFSGAWPTGEFGGMGLEGAVRLGYRKELEAIEDPDERQVLFEKMVAEQYKKGKALNTARSSRSTTSSTQLRRADGSRHRSPKPPSAPGSIRCAHSSTPGKTAFVSLVVGVTAVLVT